MRFTATVSFAIFSASLGSVAYADNYVRGYYRDNGTYVEPHYRSNPDGNAFNNYSTQGNYNPYTGKEGTVDPYRANNSGYGSNYNSYSYGSQRRY